MYVVIDHFDSFTYNLVQMLREIAPCEVRVVRSDSFSIAELERLPLAGLVFSPGPGGPDEYPRSVGAIRHFAEKVPMLGVCLGHELIVSAFGGAIRRGKRIMHGKTDETLHDGRGCFRNLSSPASFMRYHSLVADAVTLPHCLEATAWSRLDGDIMGVRHRTLPIEGVQFHPESIGSESGRRVLENFITYRREPFPVRSVLSRLLAGDDLDRKTARDFMLEAAEGNLTNVQIAGFLCALEAKGVVADEIAGCASVLIDKCVPFHSGEPVLDIVGIGGDGKGSFNLSSMAALVATACGQPVAKHGNRAVSSFCGSADFYEELGFPLMMEPVAAEALLRDTGFAFLFAPRYHSAMRHAVTARRELAIRTIMNLLGPLSNPARAEYQLLGVPEPALLRPIADAAIMLGAKRVLVITSEDGLDEISCAAPTRCVLAEEGGGVTEFIFDPTEVGITGFSSDVLRGGTAEHNAAIGLNLANGVETGGLLDAVCLNAGAGLFVSGTVESIASGYRRAKEAFSTGGVRDAMANIIEKARTLAGISEPQKKCS